MFCQNELIYISYQVLIVLFPILFYHLFFHERTLQRKRLTSKLTLILLLMLIMNMSFPVHFTKGYIYDFRMIPFMISFVYGGTIPGLITFFTLLLYRFFIGGAGFYGTLAGYSLATILLLFLGRRYETFPSKKKMVVLNLIFGFLTLVITCTLMIQSQWKQLLFVIVFNGAAWICLLLVMAIIENVYHQRNMQQELQRTEKLNTISQLAASVAHEVRNPITSVSGFLQLLQEEEELKSHQRNYLSIALQELKHAESIIHDYLSLAKPHTGGLLVINLSEEVHKTIELMASYSNLLNIKIQSYIQETLYIQGNKDEVKQILVNILKNGIEASHFGGTLEIHLYEEKGFAFVQIIDQGKGMDQHQLNKLGTPFYTTKEKGTGMGLTISYQLIEAMKGKINVKSEPGKGTTFTLSFPSIRQSEKRG